MQEIWLLDGIREILFFNNVCLKVQKQVKEVFSKLFWILAQPAEDPYHFVLISILLELEISHSNNMSSYSDPELMTHWMNHFR